LRKIKKTHQPAAPAPTQKLFDELLIKVEILQKKRISATFLEQLLQTSRALKINAKCEKRKQNRLIYIL
jgi:hypothetical protein